MSRWIVLLKTLLYNFKDAVVRYLRSKTKDLPLHVPKGGRETLKSLMERPAFQEFLTKHAQESGFSTEQVQKDAHRYLDEIAADMNYLVLPFWDFILSWAFQTLYEGLVVDTDSLDRLRPLIGKKPVIFVPNHRSHVDYLLLSYVTYCHRFPMPHVAGGINLSFWPLGWLARKSGCFFIRRAFEGDRLYAACVRFYIEAHLRQNNSLEFFIEGTRSRTGKLLPPRMGLLSFVVDGFFEGAAEDVILVPSSFTYESILEEKSYLQEQNGWIKKDESFWDILKIGRHLSKKQGKVYIRFGEPISLKDFLSGSSQDTKREKVDELAHLLTYGINKGLMVTPASITALTLLNHPRRVISLEDLTHNNRLYLDYLKYKGAPLSEPLRKFEEATFQESVQQLKLKGLLEEYDDERRPFYRVIEAKRGHLDYYKNMSLHFFVSLSVLCRLLENSPTPVVPFALLEQDYRLLQQLFVYEFTFSRRQPLTEHLGKLLEYLEQKKAITVNKDGIKRVHPEILHGYATLLLNFFESYWVVWSSLPKLGIRRWEKRELLKWLGQRGTLLYLKETIQRPEAALTSCLQNALLAFTDFKRLALKEEGWGKKKRTSFQYLPPEARPEGYGDESTFERLLRPAN